ncbi:MAG TPA: VOC family protein [Pseudomonadales bacterium]|jgi:catechol 2,3-dioxygenase-like lactoylglutathione lyase family enzyme|nr:VOC family protein [Pseudomonadales bacterium]
MKQIAPMEVGLPVIDLARMLEFYREVLSCTEVQRADIPAALSRAIRTGSAGYVNVWLRTPNGEVIKLVSPSNPPKKRASSGFSADWTGYAYLTFYCRDLDAVLAKALQSGGVLRSEPSASEGLGLKLAFFEDPEGNVIELVEPRA